MNKRIFRSKILALIVLTLAGGGGAALLAKDKPSRPPLKLEVDHKPIDRDKPLPASFAPVVKKAQQSVVYVFSSKKVHQQATAPYLNDPMFRKFFGIPGQGGGGIPRDQVQQSLGSGIIVSSDGYILTNNHVVAEADAVKVKFGKPQREYEATIVGRDADADVAVLKIEATDLPAATLGDSDEIQVGDTVLAIGNPFGVGLTVTHGIISALGRNNLNIEAFEDFIQTDAPINPGNSGGALMDSEGRVIGINTAILSGGGGGSVGVGFAIPSNLVKSLADQLVKSGKVQRGLLGVNLQELTPDLASQFGIDHGALVADVSPDSPASKAGIKTGDIITKMGEKPVEGVPELRLSISSMQPGSEVTLHYVRDGKEQVAKVKLGEREAKTLAKGEAGADQSEGVLNGVSVGDITPDIRQELQLPADLKGAVVTEVDPNSAASRAGMSKGDVVLELDRKPVHNADEAVKLSDQIPGPKVLVRYWRGGFSRYVVVDETQ